MRDMKRRSCWRHRTAEETQPITDRMACHRRHRQRNEEQNRQHEHGNSFHVLALSPTPASRSVTRSSRSNYAVCPAGDRPEHCGHMSTVRPGPCPRRRLSGLSRPRSTLLECAPWPWRCCAFSLWLQDATARAMRRDPPPPGPRHQRRPHPAPRPPRRRPVPPSSRSRVSMPSFAQPCRTSTTGQPAPATRPRCRNA